MTEKYKDLRDALADGPTPGQWLGRKDGRFTNMDGWSADHEDFTCCAAVPIKAGGEVIAIAVDGRDDLDLEMAELKANADYIAAAHPETIRALLAERDDLLENGKQAIRWAPSSAHWSNELKRLYGADARLGIDALESQLRNAQAERDALREALIAAIECGMVPKSSVTDGGASAHARQVVVADMIRAALAQHQGAGHG